MVTSVTNFGRSGLSDWLIQRVSALVLTAYVFFIVGFILSHPQLSYQEWQVLYNNFWMRLFSLLTLLSLLAHAWIGLWAVLTDYVTPLTMGNKAAAIRISLQMIIGVITLAFLLWGIEILWGN